MTIPKLIKIFQSFFLFKYANTKKITMYVKKYTLCSIDLNLKKNELRLKLFGEYLETNEKKKEKNKSE